MSMIEFDSVTKRYDDSIVAIEDVSFAVEEGTTTVLVGPSGCGKTTTMTLVNRLEDPTEGTVYYDGTPVQDLDPIELRREIGYVIQEIGLFDHMTVGENVATVPTCRAGTRNGSTTASTNSSNLWIFPLGSTGISIQVNCPAVSNSGSASHGHSRAIPTFS